MGLLIDRLREHLQHPRYRQPHRYLWWHLYDHIVPSDRNNYQPFAVHHRTLALYSALLVLLKLTVIVGPTLYPIEPLFSSAITPSNIVALTNESRESFGLNDLILNETLSKAAQAKADDMALNSYFAHTSPAGVDPWHWLKQAGYTYSYAGENLAMKFLSAEGASDAWMASTSHRANILKPQYQDIGIGISEGIIDGERVTLVVQMFGTSRVAGVAIAPAETTEVVQTLPSANPVPVAVPELAKTNLLVSDSFVLTNAGVNPFDYRVALKTSPRVAAVTVSVGNTATSLKPISGEEQVDWQGHIVLSNQQVTGVVPITAYLRAQSGSEESKRVAHFGLSPVQGIYDVTGQAESKLKPVSIWGGLVDLARLPEIVNTFFIYFAIVLFIAWVANIAIKPEVQHLDLITHSALVIILAIALILV